MNHTKLATALVSFAILALSLTPIQVSALSTASMSLSGASNTTGDFDVTVYENTGTDTVTTAYVNLTFSQPVSLVAYNYSVGPFTNALPSGAHSAFGEVTGQNAVASVHFKVLTPGTVTVAVGNGSFLKHAVRDTNGIATGVTESFMINAGSADFTYAAPVNPGMGSGSTETSDGNTSGSSATTRSTTGTTSGSSTGTTQTTSETAAEPVTPAKEEAKQPAVAKQIAVSPVAKKSSNVLGYVVGIIVVIAGLGYLFRNQIVRMLKKSAAPVAAATVAAKPAAAKKATSAKKSASSAKTAARTKKSSK